MNIEHAALWQRLEKFALDDPAASFPFTARLARENSWTLDFARRVVEEYKRFVFLTMVAGHEVTPSDEVDQAWHLHLVYTHSYWDEMCGEILGRPLHHGPTKGGHTEGVRFEDQYARTLASYEREFGVSPPADLWPPQEIRFSPEDCFVRTNVARHWIINKRRVVGTLMSAAAACVVAMLMATVLMGAAQPGNPNDPFDDLLGLARGIVIVGVVIVIAIVLVSIARRASGRGGGSGGSGCGGGFFGCSGGGGHHDGGSGCSASGCSGSGCGGGGCGGGGCGSS